MEVLPRQGGARNQIRRDMLRLQIPEQLVSDLNLAAERILSFHSTIRIFSHHDADGISAASILAKALIREDREFHLSIVGGITDDITEWISKERDELVVFLDMGSGDMERLSSLDASIIVLDHHTPKEPSENVLEINAHRYGMEGTREASGSSMAFLLALAINPRNSNLAHLSLVGSTGDRQHVGGFSGLNAKIADMGEKEGAVSSKKGLNLRNSPLIHALTRSYDPFIRGLSGREEKVRQLLDKLKIDGGKKPSELDEEEERRLGSLLILKLLKQGCRPDMVDELITTRYFIPSLGMYVSEMADYMEATSKRDAGTGVAMGIGDEEAMYRAKEMEEEYSEELMKALMTLEKNGAREMEHIQWFWSYSGEVASAQAGIGMQYLLDQEKPVFCLTELEDGRMKISARGTRYLVSKGLDLAEVCSAASKFGGSGGGHNIASGCTIPADRRKEFLRTADEMVGRQIRK